MPVIVNVQEAVEKRARKRQLEIIKNTLSLLIPISEQIVELNESDPEAGGKVCRDKMNCDVVKAFCQKPGYENIKFYCPASCDTCDEYLAGDIILTTTQNPLLTTSSYRKLKRL